MNNIILYPELQYFYEKNNKFNITNGQEDLLEEYIELNSDNNYNSFIKAIFDNINTDESSEYTGSLNYYFKPTNININDINISRIKLKLQLVNRNMMDILIHSEANNINKINLFELTSSEINIIEILFNNKISDLIIIDESFKGYFDIEMEADERTTLTDLLILRYNILKGYHIELEKLEFLFDINISTLDICEPKKILIQLLIDRICSDLLTILSTKEVDLRIIRSCPKPGDESDESTPY